MLNKKNKAIIAALYALLLAGCAVLAACGGGGGSSNNSSASAAPANPTPPVTPTPPVIPPGSVSLAGTVQGGGAPLAGATVTAYAAGAKGLAPVQIGQVTTDAQGNFSIALSPAPSAGQPVYLTSSAGAASGNKQIALMTMAGTYCTGSSCGFPTAVTINEFSTVAAVSAFQQFMQPQRCSGITGNTLTGNCYGIAGSAVTSNMAVYGDLVDPVAGQSAPFLLAACNGGGGDPDAPSGNNSGDGSTSVGGQNCDALHQLNALASIVAACVAPPSTGSTCASLMSLTGASDTIGAMLAIATQPSVRNQGSAIYALMPAAPLYLPAPDQVPPDWSLALIYTGGGLNQPAGIALDAQGHAWISDGTTPGAVTELDSNGWPLSPDSGYTGGGLNGPQGIAVDGGGNVWVANWASGGGASVTEVSATGAVKSPGNGYAGGGILGPISLAPDAGGNIWVANYSNSSISVIRAGGTVAGPYTGGGLDFPTAIGVDAGGNIWVGDSSNSVSEFSNSGAALSGSHGYPGGGLNSPYGLAFDPAGNVWVSNFVADSLTHMVGGNTPAASCPAAPAAGNTGCALNASGYAGGLAGPNALAVDSAGNVWVSNYHGGSISEFGADGTPLSPAAGYGAGQLPTGVAVDAGGNVWVSNYGDNSVTEFVGLAAPTRTPLLGPPTAP